MRYDLNKILVIDKPVNITSAKVVACVKELVGAKKAGHAGTLDPFATGVLVCCINRATKLSSFFLHGHKTYEAVLHLGIETDTQDLTKPYGRYSSSSKGSLSNIRPFIRH